MSSVAVIVPWRPGCPHRGRAWAWVNRQYAALHPDWPVFPAIAPAGAWCKARAINPAVKEAAADIVIVADADVWTTGLEEAVEQVRAGAPWAIPHDRVHRLTEHATDQLLAGVTPGRGDTLERPYQGVRGGGIVIAARQTMIDIPLDQRFVGWGQEDVAWALALHHLAGPAWRGTADLLHLFHPPQPRLSRRVGSASGQQLYRRYLAARRDRALFRALLQEAPSA